MWPFYPQNPFPIFQFLEIHTKITSEIYCLYQKLDFFHPLSSKNWNMKNWQILVSLTHCHATQQTKQVVAISHQGVLLINNFPEPIQRLLDQFLSTTRSDGEKGLLWPQNQLTNLFSTDDQTWLQEESSQSTTHTRIGQGSHLSREVLPCCCSTWWG